MGKSKAHSKHKNKQPNNAQNDPIILSKKRWSDWSNFVLGAAATTSTILYVWRKMQANQINRAGQVETSAIDAQACPDAQSSDTPGPMTEHISGNWDKGAKPNVAPRSGRDMPAH